MNRTLLASAVLFAVAASAAHAKGPAEMASDYPIRPVPGTQVEFTDGFWRPRIDTNLEKTIPYCFEQCEEKGRMESFRAAAGVEGAKWKGRFGFNDSDISKVLEGASACLMTNDDPQLVAYLDELIKLFENAQQTDGYLYTFWSAGAENRPPDDKVLCIPGGTEDRWGHVDYAHQLYNLGHMYEAAVAHWQATGKESLLDVSRESAGLLLDTFGEGKLELPPGHQEVELGLVKLYRVTGDKRLLELARYFLDLRGRKTASRDQPWGPYSQDHLPVTEQSEAVGHAVRAGYMYAAMTDIAVLTGDEEYREAVDRLWENVVGKKTHVTGGVGAHSGGEAFGADYELPNLTAYNETCAAIAQCYWNHRLFLLHGQAKYIDVLERTLYNGMLSGVDYSGERFFYPNPLASDGRHERSPWFDCSCCPTNVCRFVPAIPGYAYAVKDRDAYVNLFVAGRAELSVEGEPCVLDVATEYPWDGAIAIRVTPPAENGRFRFRVRLPGWARNEAIPGGLYTFEGDAPPPATFAVGDASPQPVDDAIDSDGYLTLERDWVKGDTVRLALPMPVRRVVADERVEADRGRVALQRGPLVYCVEHPDAPEGRVADLVLGGDAPLSLGDNPDLCGGVRTIHCSGVLKPKADSAEDAAAARVEFTAIPYFSWAHRGRGEMAVWLPTSP